MAVSVMAYSWDWESLHISVSWEVFIWKNSRAQKENIRSICVTIAWVSRCYSAWKGGRKESSCPVSQGAVMFDPLSAKLSVTAPMLFLFVCFFLPFHTLLSALKSSSTCSWAYFCAWKSRDSRRHCTITPGTSGTKCWLDLRIRSLCNGWTGNKIWVGWEFQAKMKNKRINYFFFFFYNSGVWKVQNNWKVRQLLRRVNFQRRKTNPDTSQWEWRG